mgnify:CR=1 FL=1
MKIINPDYCEMCKQRIRKPRKGGTRCRRNTRRARKYAGKLDGKEPNHEKQAYIYLFPSPWGH